MTKSTKTQETKPKNKAVSIIVNVILVLAIIFAVFATYSAYTAKQGDDLPGLFGVKMASVLTDSMHPEFDQGDMIFCHKVKDPSTLKEGDIITFWTVINGETAVNTHRIVGISEGGDYRVFTTKGDNNPVADSLTVHQNSIIGKYKFHLPKLGSAFEFLQTSTGFLIVIVIPVAIFFLWQLIQFFIALFAFKAEKVRLQFAAEMGIKVEEDADGAEAKKAPAAEKKDAPAEADPPQTKE